MPNNIAFNALETSKTAFQTYIVSPRILIVSSDLFHQVPQSRSVFHFKWIKNKRKETTLKINDCLITLLMCFVTAKVGTTGETTGEFLEKDKSGVPQITNLG